MVGDLEYREGSCKTIHVHVHMYMYICTCTCTCTCTYNLSVSLPACVYMCMYIINVSIPNIPLGKTPSLDINQLHKPVILYTICVYYYYYSWELFVMLIINNDN